MKNISKLIKPFYRYFVIYIVKKNSTHSKNTGFNTPEGYFDTFEKKLFEKISKENKPPAILPDKLSSDLKVPDTYFSSLENQLKEKLKVDQKESLQDTNPIATGFTTPKTYFENFEKDILQKTTSANYKTKVASIVSKKNILYFLGIAAMIAIIISLSINKGNGPLTIDTIDIADIQEYLLEEDVAFSTTEIATLLHDETSFTNDHSDTKISDEELENYLSDEDIEDEIIYVD